MVGKGTLSYLWVLLKLNMKAALALRAAYAVRTIFNIGNHAIYLFLWVVIFKTIPSIGGWRMEHILIAYGLGILTWGLLSFFAAGLRTLPRQIDEGSLDVYLTNPRPLLMNIALGSTQYAGPAEIIFGLVVLTIAGHLTSVSIPLLIFLGLCAFIVFASLVLAYGSLGFWLKDYHASAEEMYFNFFIMATRPEAVFHNWMGWVIVTIMPIAFMTHIPLRALIDDNIYALGLTLFGTTLSAITAYAVFRTGLKRYESGNRFGVHG